MASAHAPLSYSQVQHWNAYRLFERKAARHVASATRLQGRLNIDALQRSFAEVVRRQEALRTRIVVRDGELVQEVDETADCQMIVEEISQESEIQQRIEQMILEPIDPAEGPLFEARLLRLRDVEHVLIVVTEHLISDEVSLNLFLQELLRAYVQAATGRAFSLPEIMLPFHRYAAEQRSAEQAWLEKHGAYWNERVARDKRLRFPEHGGPSNPARIGWGAIPVRISKDLKARWLAWREQRQTTLVRSALTAYAALVLRWCNATEGVIQCATHGRSSPERAHAIGYFAAVLYPRITLREEDSFMDLMSRVAVEYREAQEHADSFYLDAQPRRPEFTRNTVFNWLPREPEVDLSDLSDSAYALTQSPVPFAKPLLKRLERDNEPVISLRELGDEIGGGVLFPLNRFNAEAMERFVRNYVMFIEQMILDRKVPSQLL